MVIFAEQEVWYWHDYVFDVPPGYPAFINVGVKVYCVFRYEPSTKSVLFARKSGEEKSC